MFFINGISHTGKVSLSVCTERLELCMLKKSVALHSRDLSVSKLFCVSMCVCVSPVELESKHIYMAAAIEGERGGEGNEVIGTAAGNGIFHHSNQGQARSFVPLPNYLSVNSWRLH